MNLDNETNPLLSLMIRSLQDLWTRVLDWLPEVTVGFILLVVFYVSSRFIRRSVRRVFYKSSQYRSAGLILGRLSQLGIMTLGVFASMTVIFPSVKAASIVNFLGISSVAIGFAFRDILQNFLAGILILLNHPFRIGDQIIVKGIEGTVQDIQTRATLIRTYDGKRVVVPNADIFTESVTVNTAFDHRRSEVVIGIGMSDNISVAKKIIQDAVLSVEGVIENKAIDTLVFEVGPSSINIRVRWWTRSFIHDVLETQDEVVAKIKTSLLANGIDLPFPTQQILFHDQTEETDGDRARQREGWAASSDKRAPQP